MKKLWRLKIKSFEILKEVIWWWLKSEFDSVLFGLNFTIWKNLEHSALHFQGSVNLLLTSMAAIDFLLLVCSILLFGIPSVSEYYIENTIAKNFNIYHYGLGPHLYTMALVFQTASVYLTVAVTIERFVAVCYPFKAREFCTRGVNTTRVFPPISIVNTFIEGCFSTFWLCTFSLCS